MQTDFQILFSVKVAHSYFENDICNCLQFVPGVDTEKILNRFKFRIKNKINGFELYSDSEKATPALLDYIQKVSGRDYFDFSIYNTNTDFAFFTELPVNWLWQMEYNSHDRLNDHEGESIILHLTLTEQNVSPVTGTLKIYFDDIINPVSKYAPVNYTISLKARSTQWQYYIINKSSLPLGNLSIGGKNNIVFKGPENVRLENGEDSLFFYSDRSDLPLSQVPINKFDLLNTVNGSAAGITKNKSSSSIIFKGLPTPEPSNIGTVVVNGKNQITSSMYIYL